MPCGVDGVTSGDLGEPFVGQCSSGTPSLWKPWGPGGVSCIQRCRVTKAYMYVFMGHSKVSLLQRCPDFRGVLTTEVSWFQGCPHYILWSRNTSSAAAV